MLQRFPLLLMVSLVLLTAPSSRAEEDVLEQLDQATSRLTAEKYELKYRFVAGETIRYQVEHLATVDTRISGNSQEQKSRSISTKAWKVEDVDPEEGIKFVHLVEDVDMWSKVSGRQEVRYNSREDQTPPDEYSHVAKSLNVPLATVTIDAHGNILKRESQADHPDLGFGGLVMPLPKGEVPIGHSWAVPHTLKVRQRDGRVKEIKTRLRYRLEKVQTGVATISVRTQVLTPVNDPRLKSQMIQQESNGEIKFDVDAGRIISKRLDWDANVIGFNGADSNMKYLARFTEELMKPEVARAKKAGGKKES